MYQTLKIATPTPDAALKKPLLTPVRTLSNQLASVALRAWWESNTEDDLAHRGLRVWRDHISEQNADIDASSIPVLQLSEAIEGQSEILAVIFPDQSALVLRSEAPFSGSPSGHDRFQVLPIVLNLSSRFRPSDERADFSLKVKRDRRASALPIITVSNDNPDDGWINLEAGHFCSEVGANWEIRQAIKSDILSCARAWAAEMDYLPVLHFPEQGYGYKSEAILDTMLGSDLGLDPHTPYACPAFLPYCAYAESEAEAYQAFCRALSEWMLLHSPAHLEAVHMVVLSARMSQTNKASKPKASVKITGGAGGDLDPEWSAHLTKLLQKLLRLPEAPICFDRLVGQSVNRTPMRTVSSFIVENTVAFAHISRKDLEVSNHKKLSLDQRFGQFPAL